MPTCKQAQQPQTPPTLPPSPPRLRVKQHRGTFVGQAVALPPQAAHHAGRAQQLARAQRVPVLRAGLCSRAGLHSRWQRGGFRDSRHKRMSCSTAHMHGGSSSLGDWLDCSHLVSTWLRRLPTLAQQRNRFPAARLHPTCQRMVVPHVPKRGSHHQVHAPRACRVLQLFPAGRQHVGGARGRQVGRCLPHAQGGAPCLWTPAQPRPSNLMNDQSQHTCGPAGTG